MKVIYWFIFIVLIAWNRHLFSQLVLRLIKFCKRCYYATQFSLIVFLYAGYRQRVIGSRVFGKLRDRHEKRNKYSNNAKLLDYRFYPTAPRQGG